MICRHRKILLCGLLVAALSGGAVHAQNDTNSPDLLESFEDPFDSSQLIDNSVEDEKKTAQQLVQEGRILLMDERPLDARTKWLLALRKAPDDYKIHLLLASYYLDEVNHYRLAMRYLKQGEAHFLKQRGQPPFSSYEDQSTHSMLLSLLSSIRLNLDNYEGALAALDEYYRWGYFSEWYPSSRAWVLMKLGRIKEAISVARQGEYLTPESKQRGSVLNMLGILLSMDGQREQSLKILDQAIRLEYSLGRSGQPGTPLNNQGEVLHELFREQNAERNWLRATSQKDGCEHVLPSLWLSILYNEQTNFQESKGALDRFMACIAQFPYRNTEEHRAIVHLARGRISLHTGHPDDAVSHLEVARSRQQWFGKIGTNSEDLQAAALTSYAQALRAQARWLQTRVSTSIAERLQFALKIKQLQLRAWWSQRRAEQVLAENLNDLEDLEIHHTDSMLEYSTLGDTLNRIPVNLLREKVKRLQTLDSRAHATLFYRSYIAQAELSEGDTEVGIKEILEIFPQLRPRLDNLLRAHLLTLYLRIIETEDGVDSDEYVSRVSDLYSWFPAQLRNAGLPLPIELRGASSRLEDLFSSSPFIISQNKQLMYKVEARYQQTGPAVHLELSKIGDSRVLLSVEGASEAEALNSLSDKAFSVNLS